MAQIRGGDRVSNRKGPNIEPSADEASPLSQVLDLPSQPWARDTTHDASDQSSGGFRTAQATPAEELDSNGEFPFHTGSHALDGTFVSLGPHRDESSPVMATNGEGKHHAGDNGFHSRSVFADIGVNNSTSDVKNVSFVNGTTGDGPFPGSELATPKRPIDGMKSRRSDRFVSRVKALKLPGNVAQAGDGESGSSPAGQTFQISPQNLLHRRGHSDGEYADADVEETEDEGPGPIRGPATKRRKIYQGLSNTAPSTPQTMAFSSSNHNTPRPSFEHSRFRPVRRSTADEALDKGHLGLSEDEGRARMGRRGDWRRKSSAFVQGVRHPASGDRRRSFAQETPSRSRPKHIRRVTGEDSSEPGPSGAEASPSAWRMRTEPAAHRWRQLKAGLKLMGPKRKEPKSQDQIKSTELITELLAGAPAATLLTSHFLRDERHQRRIPVLLEQLKFKVTDSQLNEDAGPNRNIIFRIELEYGSGDMRMKWVIYRSLPDFWNLHVKFGTQIALAKFQRPPKGGKKAKIPRFPRTAFPFAGDFHGTTIEDEEDEEQPEEPPENPEPPIPAQRPGHRRKMSSMHFRRRSSVGVGDTLATANSDPVTPGAEQQSSAARKAAGIAKLADKQRGKLEAYLKAMIKFVMFRPGMNRMCGFLELSALGIKLAVEGGYHGKEGSLRLHSGNGVDFRRAWLPQPMYNRHKSMWFLVRSSYIVCVDSPASMNVYDVFLIDGDFTVVPKRPRLRDQTNAKDIAKTAGHAARHPQHHVLRLSNSERRLRLFAKSQRQMEQFESSMKQAAEATLWSQRHRFGSFAPVRTQVYAQWLVDARDYMWNVSRALSMARDVIYIHDWWLSPELYMRRPGAISHKWRLDRILKRKAEEGVKVFVILYRNIESAIPIDSEYTKHALLDLHTNIFVQRSPNQYRSNVFFWAHHEKICIVDQTIAFCGGVDLCYGRWDSPDHRVVDDRPTGWEMTENELNSETCQMWAGKDYSNPRVRDFFSLNQPFSEMYDRTKVPRMPWHDIGMQIVGQPARDLTRHFVQRWNYLLRVRKTSRPTPFLMPPPDFSQKQLEELGLEGTCTVQMLRSASEWSLGTPRKTEHSIVNAYCKLIQTSEHFVYMENQFFISSCTVEGTRIQNAIGDALVERIIRANEDGEDWACVIVIPLMPGFQATVDSQDGSSIRLIMQCQYRSICRGESSIFGRLRAAGIQPTDYIRFFSLRSWGKIGPTKALVTEQLYIHAKCMIVDDRHVIIGSANINERSMLGDRDSEVASCVFDNDMIESLMGGVPYKVGRFPHTLRKRLMREHLGIDVDHVMDSENFDDMFASEPELSDGRPSSSESASSHPPQQSPNGTSAKGATFDTSAEIPEAHTYNHDAPEIDGTKFTKANKAFTSDSRVTGTEKHRKDVAGFGVDNMHALENEPIAQSRDTVLLNCNREVLVNNSATAGKGSLSVPAQRSATSSVRHSFNDEDQGVNESVKAPLPPRPTSTRLHTSAMGLPVQAQLPALPTTDDTDIGGPPLQQTFTRRSAESLNPQLANMRRPVVDEDCMRDPLNRSFLDKTWQMVAENNTKLYRQVFRCMPDNKVTNWTQYNAAMAYSERFAHSQGMDESHLKMQQEAHGRTGPPGHNIDTHTHKFARSKQHDAGDEKPKSLASKISQHVMRKKGESRPTTGDGTQSPGDDEKSSQGSPGVFNEKEEQSSSTPDTAHSNLEFDTLPSKEKEAARQGSFNEKSGDINNVGASEPIKTRKRAGTRSSGRGPDTLVNKTEAEALMNLVQGHLVEWPYDWLEQEERGGKWLYSVDQMAPLEIYN